MIPDSFRKWQVQVASGAITGAAPQQFNGNAVDLSDVQPGTLAARINAGITTTSLTYTGKWQVQNKAGTWIDVAHEAQNPAGVAWVTGSGSLVTSEKVFPAPMAVYGFKKARFVIVTAAGTAAGGTADVVNALDYSYLTAWINF